jgi:hypothetical protein
LPPLESQADLLRRIAEALERAVPDGAPKLVSAIRLFQRFQFYSLSKQQFLTDGLDELGVDLSHVQK